VVQYAPFPLAAGQAIAVAEYDLSRLRFALDPVKPSTAWVVNANGEVVASTTGFVAFERFARGQLRGPAAASYDGPGISVSQSGVDTGEIVAFAPVRGADKTPVVPKWGLVTARSVNAVLLPQTQARDQALLVGLALTVVTVGVFSWMYVMWLRPLRRLVRDTDRIAQGDLTTAVEIRRHDEIGLIAGSVERIRVGLIRDITASRQPDHTQPLRTVPMEVD
jgi:HAMP domain-containing protein